MNLTTQLDLGQKVWYIENNSTFTWVDCPTCDGSHKVNIKGVEHRCPNRSCFNGKIRKDDPLKWKITRTLTIGMIRCEVRDSPGIETKLDASNYQPQKGSKEEYMCVETGIGSGYIHRLGEHIFASEEDAQVGCDRLNATKES